MALWVERAALRDFSVRRMAITRGGQVFLKLQPFVERHGRLFALWRRVVNTCFRLGPRI
jgi:hypothetical protein